MASVLISLLFLALAFVGAAMIVREVGRPLDLAWQDSAARDEAHAWAVAIAEREAARDRRATPARWSVPVVA